jgi:GTPase SAR1 family protein
MFALNNPISFEQVVDKWKPELNHYHPNVPILLCGSKLDTRTSMYFSESFRGDEIVMVSREEGEYMAKKMGCIGYVEVSAKKKIGVNEVFDAALRCVGVDVNVPKKECVCS